MLPEKRKELIIWIVSIIGVILVIIIMYNFAKFMRDIGSSNDPEEIIYDDPYPSEYVYYGFMVDDDGNYQLMGFNSEFNETILGLRTFYLMNNLYYYNNHLVLYNDAINQINYNAKEAVFSFYEQNSFFSNNVDVLITPSYYVFASSEKLEYCEYLECSEVIGISDKLINAKVFSSGNKVYYQLDDGVHEYDLSTSDDNLIVENSRNVLNFLAINDNYLIFMVGDSYWMYNINNKIAENISEYINLETGLEFVSLDDNSLYFETTNTEGNNEIVEFSLRERVISGDTYNIGEENVFYSYQLSDGIIYAELSREDEERYVIMDMDEKVILKELENPYVVIREIE